MAVVEAERYLFTIEEFDRLFEADIFTEDDRVEFVDGEIIAMSSIGGRHVGTIVRLTGTAYRAVGDSFAISVQNPLRIRDRASFLPDLAILRTANVGNVVPTADLVLLVMEVSESSRNYDRNTKLLAYASAGIPEAWICDLIDDRLERHTDPRDGAYQQVAVARRGVGDGLAQCARAAVVGVLHRDGRAAAGSEGCRCAATLQ